MSRVARASVLVTVLNVGGLLGGLAVYAAIAARFGVTSATDAFFLALAIPALFVGPALSAITSTLVPVLADERASAPERLGVVLGSAIGAASAAALLASVALAFLAPAVALATGRALTPALRGVVVADALCLMPVVLLQTVTTILAAGYTVVGQYGVPGIGTVARQGATLVLLLALARVLERWALPVAFTAGALVQFGVLVGRWRATGIRLRLRLRPDPRLAGAARQALPLWLGTQAIQVGLLVLRLFAARLGPGAVTALDFASRLAVALTEVVTTGVLLVALAEWSNANAGGAVLAARVRSAMLAVLFLTAPVAAIGWSLRRVVVAAWLGASPSVAPLVPVIGDTLGVFVVVLPLEFLGRLSVQHFVICRRAAVVGVASFARAGLTLLVVAPLANAAGPPGLALADAAGIAAALVLLRATSPRATTVSTRSDVRSIATVVASAAAVASAVSYSVSLLRGWSPLPVLLLTSIGGLLVYVLLTSLFGLREVARAKGALAGMLRTVTQPS